MLVVPDAFRDLNIRGFQQVVVDEKVGLQDLTRDVHRRRIEVGRVTSMLVMVGRADVMFGESVVVFLGGFLEALEGKGFTGKLTVTGPLPKFSDGEQLCKRLAIEREAVFNYAVTHKRFAYSHMGEVLCISNRVIPELLNARGLTNEGH